VLNLILRRLWVVALLALVAGLTAWLTTRGQEKLYDRTLSFVVRPGQALTDSQVPDATRGLAQENGRIANTIGGVLGSDRFLRVASEEAELEGVDGSYSIGATIRPGRDIIDVALRGPDREVLGPLARAYSRVSEEWVGEVYRGAYELEFLNEEPSNGPVAPQTGQSVSLAILLGALLGFGIVFLEARVRQMRGSPVADRADLENQALVAVEVNTGRADRVEEILRSELQDGERVVRIGPGRLGIVRDAVARGSRSGRSQA
jgi:hypothetical protein